MKSTQDSSTDIYHYNSNPASIESFNGSITSGNSSDTLNGTEATINDMVSFVFISINDTRVRPRTQHTSQNK